MQVINYENIVDIPISEVDNSITGGSGDGVAGIDNEKINGAISIYNYPEQEQTSIAGWTTTVSRTPTNYRKVSWGNGNIYLPYGTTLSVTAGDTGNMSALTYIYYDMENMTVATTTTAQDAVGVNKLLLCVAKPNSVSTKFAEFQAFGTDAQSTFITADNIAANTITANEIASNTITANEIRASDITGNNLIGNTISGKTIQGCTIRAYNGSGANLDEIKMWTDGTLPKIQVTDNGTVVGAINGTSTTIGGVTVNALVMGGSGKYLGLVGNVFVSGKFKLPVGTNLYF